jgi:hypothetical protein
MKNSLLICFVLISHTVGFSQIRVYSDSLYNFDGIETYRGKPFIGIKISLFSDDDTSRISSKESYKDGLLSGLSIYYGADSEGNYWVTDKKIIKYFLRMDKKLANWMVYQNHFMKMAN